MGIHTCSRVQKAEGHVLGALCLSLKTALSIFSCLRPRCACLQPCLAAFVAAELLPHPRKHSYSLSLLPGPIVSSSDDKFKFCCVSFWAAYVSLMWNQNGNHSLDCLLSSNRGLLACAYVCMSMPLMSDIELGD